MKRLLDNAALALALGILIAAILLFFVLPSHAASSEQMKQLLAACKGRANLAFVAAQMAHAGIKPEQFHWTSEDEPGEFYEQTREAVAGAWQWEGTFEEYYLYVFNDCMGSKT